MSPRSGHLDVYKSDQLGLSLPSAPYLWWRSCKVIWVWFVNVVFSVGSSLDWWGLYPYPFQSEWARWPLCCIKYGRSRSVPVFWAKVLRDCSLDFLHMETLTLWEASCHVKSLTALRLPCEEEVPDTCLERLCGERDANEWSQQGAGPVRQSPQVILASDGKQEPLESWEITKRCYFEPLSFEVVGYLALENHSKEMFYFSLSEERRCFDHPELCVSIARGWKPH